MRRVVVMGVFEVEYDEMGFSWIFICFEGELNFRAQVEVVVFNQQFFLLSESISLSHQPFIIDKYHLEPYYSPINCFPFIFHPQLRHP